MPSATGFGLGDGPFVSDGLLSFDDLSRGITLGGSSAPVAAGGSGGDSFFDRLMGSVGRGVEQIADFTTQLFIFDELNERRPVGTTSSTTTNTNTGTGSTAASGTASASLIKGVSNSTLVIGGAVLVGVLLVFKFVK